ncbi:MAG: hypothetical protein ACI8UO_005860 [Verrucomicrobiales bacterium]|jgi:hypothetical protein
MFTKSVLFLALVISSQLSSVNAQDSPFKDQLPGKWKHEHRQLGVSADTFKVYKADGTFTAVSKINLIGIDTAVAYKGTWAFLKSGSLRLQVKESSNTLYVGDDDVFLLKGVKIVEGVMSYEHDGDPNREVQLKDEE